MDEFENTNEESLVIDDTERESEDIKREEILEILLNTREQGEMIDRFIKNQIAIKDEMIDKLHRELEFYKQDSADRFTEQLLKAFIKVYCGIKKTYNSVRFAEMDADALRTEYGYAVDDIKDFLELQNVDEIVSQEGDEFDGSKQQAVKTEETDDITLDKRIKCSQSSGFVRNGKTIVTERVVVYQYKNNQ